MTAINPHFIFCHAPKCGGTSIKSVVGGLSREFPQHPPSQVLRELRPGKPIVGFIRNPFDRMVSLYYFVAYKTPGGAPHDRHRYDLRWIQRAGFKRWLLEGADYMDSDPIAGNWFDWRSRRYRLRSESEWPGIGKAYMRHGLPPIQQRPAMWWHHETDHVGKLETAQADLDRFCDLTGHPRVAIPHCNGNSQRPRITAGLYDSEMVDFVRRFHEADFVKGEYEWKP